MGMISLLWFFPLYKWLEFYQVTEKVSYPIKDVLFTLNVWKMVPLLKGLLITGLLITLELFFFF